mmetsp:Transcript_14245/g.48233  ORF Transcript_14245/g.48233 Transcript_14245/m.48233 type:complete len:362 (+) Transcript_14245:127-1212(+)
MPPGCLRSSGLKCEAHPRSAACGAVTTASLVVGGKTGSMTQTERTTDGSNGCQATFSSHSRGGGYSVFTHFSKRAASPPARCARRPRRCRACAWPAAHPQRAGARRAPGWPVGTGDASPATSPRRPAAPPTPWARALDGPSVCGPRAQAWAPPPARRGHGRLPRPGAMLPLPPRPPAARCDAGQWAPHGARPPTSTCRARGPRGTPPARGPRAAGAAARTACGSLRTRGRGPCAPRGPRGPRARRGPEEAARSPSCPTCTRAAAPSARPRPRDPPPRRARARAPRMRTSPYCMRPSRPYVPCGRRGPRRRRSPVAVASTPRWAMRRPPSTPCRRSHPRGPRPRRRAGGGPRGPGGPRGTRP